MNIEKRTIWKISEMEEALKRRVTAEYVDDSVRVMEEKLKKEVNIFISFQLM